MNREEQIARAERDFSFRCRYRDLVLKHQEPFSEGGGLTEEERKEFFLLRAQCKADAVFELEMVRFMTGSPLTDDELATIWDDFKQKVLSK